MRIVRLIKLVVAPVLICVFSASGAYAVATAGTACGLDGGDALLDGFTFAAHGDCASVTNDFKLHEDTYQFTVSGDDVMGVQLSGNKQTVLLSFENLNDGTDKQWTAMSGDEISNAFELGQGDYILRVIGLKGEGTYDLALTAVPVPAAVWLLGSVLLGLGVIGRKRGLGGQVAVSG